MHKDPNPHLLARAIIARCSLDAHRRDVCKQIGSRTRALGLAIDAIASHDVDGTELPLEGTDSLSPDILRLIDNPKAGL
jgi:hypothetical protein